MSADFETTLDECLVRVDRGENLDACLGAFPALAADLRPLLEMAVGLRAAPPPRARPEAVVAGKERVMAALAAQPPARFISAPTIWQRLTGALHHALLPSAPVQGWHALRFALAILVVLGLGATGSVVASAHSLPGDALYPVKQSIESLRLAFTFDDPSRQRLESQFAGQRLLEVQSLIQLRREERVEFSDVLHAMGDNGYWVVGPFAVQINDSTLMTRRPALGSRVLVEARVRNDGTLLALRVTETTEHGHDLEHPSGPDQTQFISPLQTAPPAHEPEHEALPDATNSHVEEPADLREHEAVPTIPAPAPPTAVATHHPESTEVPHDMQWASPSTSTHAPSHEPAPTMAPARHEGAPTGQPPHHDPTPRPREEPHYTEPAPVHDGNGAWEHR